MEAFCKDTVKVEQADSRKLPSGFHTADAHMSFERSIWGGGGRSCGLADKGKNEKEMRRYFFFPLNVPTIGSNHRNLKETEREREIERNSLLSKEI